MNQSAGLRDARNDVATADRSRVRSHLLVAAVAVVACFNVLPNDFCDDGIPIVARSEKVNGTDQWKNVWTTDHWSAAAKGIPNRDLLYRPIALSSYRLVRIIAGVHPLPHHIVNLLLHAAICLGVMCLCRHIGGSSSASTVAGLVFAVLPIHSSVLNNVVGRADLLATAGTLAAILAHRRVRLSASLRVQDGRFRHTVAWTVIAAVCAFIAMGSKESGVCVLALVVLFDLSWHLTSNGHPRAKRWFHFATVARLIYLVVPTGVYLGLRYHALGGVLHQRPALTKTVNVLVDAPLWQHTLGVIQLWGMYWAKTIWPKVLCVNYSINAIRLPTSILDGYVMLGILVTIVLTVASIVAWRHGRTRPTGGIEAAPIATAGEHGDHDGACDAPNRGRAIAFASLAVVVAYLPTSNALVLMQVYFAERIWYLPSVFVAILAGFAVVPTNASVHAQARGLYPRMRSWMNRGVWRVGLVVVLLGMMGRGWIRSSEWRNNGTLYASAYDDHPHSIGALYHFGRWLVEHAQDESQLRLGVKLLNEGLAIDVGSTDCHRAIAHGYARLGLPDLALRHLRIAHMHAPGHPPTEALLARVSRELSQRDAAELRELQNAAAANPADRDAQLALIRKLRGLGRAEEALEHLEAQSARFDGNAIWQSEFAITLLNLDRRDEAIERYRRGVELAPRDPTLILELATLLFERREPANGPNPDDVSRAWQLTDRVEEIAPGWPKALAFRAELYALRGDLQAAARYYRLAIKATPREDANRAAYENRLKTLGGE